MRKILIVAMSILLMAVAATAADAPDTVEQSFIHGETLLYDLTWLHVSGGTATLSIAPLDAGRYRIGSLAQSSPSFSKIFNVRDEIESVVGRDDFSTLSYRKTLNERGKSKQENTSVDETRKVAMRKGKEIAVPSPVFDPLSLIYHIRTLDLTPGRIHHFTVLSDGKVYTLEAIVGDRETISTDAGTFKAIRVEPKMQGGGIFRDEDDKLYVWYSDDAYHVPVRIRSEIKVGTITASLKTIRVGVNQMPAK